MRRVAAVAMAVLLGFCSGSASPCRPQFEVTARQQLYRDLVVYAERTPYQEIVIDQPDRTRPPPRSCTSPSFYALVRHALVPGGRLAVQARSPYFAARSYWCIEALVPAAGFAVTP